MKFKRNRETGTAATSGSARQWRFSHAPLFREEEKPLALVRGNENWFRTAVSAKANNKEGGPVKRRSK